MKTQAENMESRPQAKKVAVALASRKRPGERTNSWAKYMIRKTYFENKNNHMLIFCFNKH
jgi:hypothetical protein